MPAPIDTDALDQAIRSWHPEVLPLIASDGFNLHPESQYVEIIRARYRRILAQKQPPRPSLQPNARTDPQRANAVRMATKPHPNASYSEDSPMTGVVWGPAEDLYDT